MITSGIEISNCGAQAERATLAPMNELTTGSEPAELVTTFIDAMRIERGLGENTLAAYERDLEAVLRHVQKPPAEVARADFIAFLAAQRDTGLSGRTMARRLSALRAFFDFLLTEGCIEQNPVRNVASPKQWRVLPRLLDSEALTHMLLPPELGCPPLRLRDWTILQLLYHSGLRVSELCNLRIADLDLEHGRALVVQGKGRKDRLVPLGHAVDAIRRYLREARSLLCAAEQESSDHLFIGEGRGSALTRQRVWRIVRAAGGINPHRLRHTLATNLIERGCGLRSVQAVLGHEDISTTALYLHVDISHVRSQLLKFHPRANWQGTAS